MSKFNSCVSASLSYEGRESTTMFEKAQQTKAKTKQKDHHLNQALVKPLS